MSLDRKSTNSDEKIRTNLPDWSALIPVLPAAGKRTPALYRELRRLIEAGDIPPGAKLPPSRDLAGRLKTSRGSVVAAFEMLIAEGYAEARTGAGTFVAGRVPTVKPTAPAASESIAPKMPLPGTLGVAMADARTLGLFRTLLSRHLARPGPEHFYYGDPRGGDALRQAIAAYLRQARGVRCEARSIVITTGIQQGIDLVIRGALAAGDRVMIEDPCYPSARAALAGAGLVLTGLPVDDEGADIGQAVPGAKAVYVTPSHQFPLGVAMSMRRRLALIDWARETGGWILEDDYDSEFRFAGPPLAAMQGMDDSGRVIYLGTFSKVLFPGLRLGYAVIPDALLDQVIALRIRTDRSPPTLAEAALTDLIREGHFSAHLRRARRQAQAARDALVAGLSTTGRLAVAVPDQGLHLVATLPTSLADTEAVEIARQVGLGVRALSAMAVTHAPRQGLVIGFSGFAPEVLEAAARRFAVAIAGF
ncbi:PLP-dependent aminotransferase family protein [Shinella curvata]|uniref:PLP-dependent aminotransferase family protein n=1 Tax=Shinella curvata TaxID=1817964 RepID=A0ABT8XDI0_9HYPH|nr:PLP-dependent aminotransferase family protein [Shinella curvata]MCJ8054438.1 PLP-dependent aminotransferase family protein [Shinella curvata]MDO6121459.1 PLP-dependent aminotransferase family protein [Shinella curvata]